MPAINGKANLKRGLFFIIRGRNYSKVHSSLQHQLVRPHSHAVRTGHCSKGAQGRNNSMRIGILEHRITGNKSIGARCSKQLAGIDIHTTVNLNESL